MGALLAEVTMPDAVQNIFDIATKAISLVTANAVLMTFFCAGVVGIGIGVIRKLKRQ